MFLESQDFMSMSMEDISHLLWITNHCSHCSIASTLYLHKHLCSASKFDPHPPAAPLQPWQRPIRPSARIHIDLASPMEGKVVIDAHSKWIKAQPMSTTTATATVEQLICMFA